MDTATNLKYKTLLSTIYSAGLRVSEVVNLQIHDIDSKNMYIRVQQAKGKKDRYTLLSQTNLELLRDYWRAYRPMKWLFPGRNPDQPYSTRSVQRIFNTTCKQAGIQKPATVHTLRHSFATHLLESGVGLYHVQKLLGHASPKTTNIYIHLTQHDILKVRSPLDLIGGLQSD